MVKRSIFFLFLTNIFRPDYAGKVKVCELKYPGSVAMVALQLPQTFHRFQCESHLQLAEARWTYFVEKVNNTPIDMPS